MDLSELGNYQCSDWVDYPITIRGATGGLLGTSPIICGGGGLPITDKCYVINKKKAKLVGKMSTKRYLAASVTINDTLLWVSGGKYDKYNDNTLSSSEFFHLENGTMPGPELPLPLQYHAMIMIASCY